MLSHGDCQNLNLCQIARECSFLMFFLMSNKRSVSNNFDIGPGYFFVMYTFWKKGNFSIFRVNVIEM